MPKLFSVISNRNKNGLESLLFTKPPCPVGWGRRIHRQHLCRGVRPLPNEYPDYDKKQSDDEVPEMLEL